MVRKSCEQVRSPDSLSQKDIVEQDPPKKPHTVMFLLLPHKPRAATKKGTYPDWTFQISTLQFSVNLNSQETPPMTSAPLKRKSRATAGTQELSRARRMHPRHRCIAPARSNLVSISVSPNCPGSCLLPVAKLPMYVVLAKLGRDPWQSPAPSYIRGSIMSGSIQSKQQPHGLSNHRCRTAASDLTTSIDPLRISFPLRLGVVPLPSLPVDHVGPSLPCLESTRACRKSWEVETSPAHINFLPHLQLMRPPQC
ncbi:hypothetical protein SODALDRAFT_379915 [Sodiomyces alkalinus F11]|uniref:Uncharacterized protein n=1 Tax=Sodiomyces alkalinus (strain CBS 110278 / VKM F-3762 / F11) TaxID=1314773 RepID=A0A3N2PSG1_SODAK|nr:hypothetical protein SODALDRAFT_379915 [Sodiomyces alkalinus F11]ROT37459.1 hypothetical protein SODALDRAFT_379915 [Sodiomyces alkalinus F11]